MVFRIICDFISDTDINNVTAELFNNLEFERRFNAEVDSIGVMDPLLFREQGIYTCGLVLNTLNGPDGHEIMMNHPITMSDPNLITGEFTQVTFKALICLTSVDVTRQDKRYNLGPGDILFYSDSPRFFLHGNIFKAYIIYVRTL